MRNFFIDSTNKTINLSFYFNNSIKAEIKDCGVNVRFNSEFKTWIVPINSFSKDRISKIIKKYNFIQIFEKEHDSIEFCYKKENLDYTYLKGLCNKIEFSYIPRDYQLESLGYALKKGNIIIGDDVGLGKTFEAIMYAEVTKSFPCLIIVPASIKYNWQEKWLEITNNKRSVSVIESSNQNDWKSDVIIINYDILSTRKGKSIVAKFSELMSTCWKMVIFDEAHFLKNKQSQRSVIAKKLTIGEDVKILMLTGTATMSRPIELWNLLVISKNDRKIAGSWYQFATKYCGAYRGNYGWITSGATNILELNKKLRDSCYIRREKRDVLKELPLVNKQILKVSITNIKEINKATDNFIDYIREVKGNDSAEKAMEAEHLVAIGMLRQLSIEGKLKAIEQYIKDWKENNNGKLLIFGIHRAPLEYLATKFKSKLISGGVTSKNKQYLVENWIKNNENFLFANMQSAGTGVDGLQHTCSNMLILELPWRPSDIDQAIGRLDRSGQKISPNVTFMLSDNTIDKQMIEMLENKEYVTSAVNKGIDIKKNKSGISLVVSKILKKAKAREKLN